MAPTVALSRTFSRPVLGKTHGTSEDPALTLSDLSVQKNASGRSQPPNITPRFLLLFSTKSS